MRLRASLLILLAMAGGASLFGQEPVLSLVPPKSVQSQVIDNSERANPMSDIRVEPIVPGTNHIEIEEDQIFLLMTVENRPMRFCIDTGSSFSMMEPDAASSFLDGKIHQERSLHGYAGIVSSTRWTRPLAFHFPGVTGRASMIVMPTGLSRSVSLQVDGVLGLDLLSQFRVCIDYAAQTVTFSLPDSAPPPGASFPVTTFKILLPVAVTGKAGTRSGVMMLDTGASGNLKLFRGAKELGYDDMGEVTEHALGGQVVNHCVKVPAFIVGGFPFNNLVAQLDNGTGIPGEGQNLIGAIGGNILHHFRITLDLPNNAVDLQPNDPIEMPDNEPEPSLINLGGVYPNSPENKTKMDEHFRVLSFARQGNPAAAEYVGVNYASGRGVPQDFNQAAFWLKKAAAQNRPVADYVLGMMYETGYGVPMNTAQAVTLYQAAAEQGDAMAEFALGRLFEIGNGVMADLPTAKSWYEKAASHGNAPAKSALARINGTPLEIAQPAPQPASTLVPPAPAQGHYSGK